MKKKDQEKNLPNSKYSVKPSVMLKAYLEMIVLTHKNVGALRMIFAYIFIVFALICFWFTITVPVTSEFKPPTTGEGFGSRMISLGMMLANLISYGIIMTWKKIYPAPLPIRIAFIGIVLYIDVWLIGRVAYMLICDGNF